ncbi:MAG: high-potential iron-sulfur protein [Deltaproteobacteria bacterium]|nr:high-potential iron-sulfur protein [Deltaproteobacteria bacterium]
MNRRHFFKEAGLLGAAAAGAAMAISACKSSGGEAAPAVTCTDTAGLTEAELSARMDAEYVDHSQVPGKMCSTCALFEAPATEGKCGGCKVVKGPINPQGYCKLWAQKPA